MRPNSVAQTTSVSSSSAALLEVLQQAGDRLVDLRAIGRVVLPQVAVGVPAAGVAVAAVIDLHEPHAALHQPPRRQAMLAERRGVLVIEAVQLLRRGRFLLKLEDFGHARCMRNASSYDLIRRAAPASSRILGDGQAIEPLEQLELGLLLLAKDALGGPAEGERVRRIGDQRHAVVLGPEVVGAVRFLAAAAIGRRGCPARRTAAGCR